MQPAFQAPMGWQAWPAGQQPGFWLQPAAAVVSAAAPAGELPLAVTQLGFTAWVAAGLPQLQLFWQPTASGGLWVAGYWAHGSGPAAAAVPVLSAPTQEALLAAAGALLNRSTVAAVAAAIAAAPGQHPAAIPESALEQPAAAQQWQLRGAEPVPSPPAACTPEDESAEEEDAVEALTQLAAFAVTAERPPLAAAAEHAGSPPAEPQQAAAAAAAGPAAAALLPTDVGPGTEPEAAGATPSLSRHGSLGSLCCSEQLSEASAGAAPADDICSQLQQTASAAYSRTLQQPPKPPVAVAPLKRKQPGEKALPVPQPPLWQQQQQLVPAPAIHFDSARAAKRLHLAGEAVPAAALQEPAERPEQEQGLQAAPGHPGWRRLAPAAVPAAAAAGVAAALPAPGLLTAVPMAQQHKRLPQQEQPQREEQQLGEPGSGLSPVVCRRLQLGNDGAMPTPAAAPPASATAAGQPGPAAAAAGALVSELAAFPATPTAAAAAVAAASGEGGEPEGEEQGDVELAAAALLQAAAAPAAEPGAGEAAGPEEAVSSLTSPRSALHLRAVGTGVEALAPTYVTFYLPPSDPAFGGAPGATVPVTCRFLFQKVLSASDVGKLGRIVLPRCTENHLPQPQEKEGVWMDLTDPWGRVFSWHLTFWLSGGGGPAAPFQGKRTFLFENCRTFQQEWQLEPKSVLAFYQMPSGAYLIDPNPVESHFQDE